MARTVHCIKHGKEAEGLDSPPCPGELGKRIFDSVSKEAWAAWLRHQTMLLNENRLNLADARARQYLARQMEKHFFGEGADQAAGYVPPPAPRWHRPQAPGPLHAGLLLSEWAAPIATPVWWAPAWPAHRWRPRCAAAAGGSRC